MRLLMYAPSKEGMWSPYRRARQGPKQSGLPFIRTSRPPVDCWDWLKTLTALQDPKTTGVLTCLKRARLKPQPPHCIYYYYYNQNFYPSDRLLSQCETSLVQGLESSQ